MIEPHTTSTAVEVEQDGTAAPSNTSVQSVPYYQIMKERDEYLNGWKRALADFENFKRDTQTRMNDTRRSERIKLLREILPVIDTIERTIAHVPKEEHKTGWFQGLVHIQSQWAKFMDEHNLDKINAVGDPFDPTIHEAIQIENRPDAENHTILAVVQPGYRFDSVLIRPAQVIVNNLPQAEQ